MEFITITTISRLILCIIVSLLLISSSLQIQIQGKENNVYEQTISRKLRFTQVDGVTFNIKQGYGRGRGHYNTTATNQVTATNVAAVNNGIDNIFSSFSKTHPDQLANALPDHFNNQSTITFTYASIDPTGTKHEKKKEEFEIIHGTSTWHVWKERPDTSQYFTKDYAHVKRRRPIHNKSLPLAP